MKCNECGLEIEGTLVHSCPAKKTSIEKEIEKYKSALKRVEDLLEWRWQNYPTLPSRLKFINDEWLEIKKELENPLDKE